ncbi:MAG: glycoside hydrolase family 1 protein [Myxococcales bacterium]|nr:glycoside hydrolase family 1 protein [Myxococcales bacterium]
MRAGRGGLVVVFGLAGALGALGACTAASPGPTATAQTRPAEVTFPKGFLMGSATASFQIERDNGGTDWGVWSTLPGKIKRGDKPDDGPDALAHIDEDIASLVATSQNAYRFSLEWGKLYPTRAAFDSDTPDPAVLAKYTELIQKLRAAKITLMLTLSHFTLPVWLADPRVKGPYGWEQPETVTAFGGYCERIAKRFGKDVDLWATINEPVVAPLGGYIEGGFPPGLTLEVDRALTVIKAEVRGHALCYDAIKRVDKDDADGDGQAALVGPVIHQRDVLPRDPKDPEDKAAAQRVRYVNNLWFANAAVFGDYDDDFDGKLDGPNDKRADAAIGKRADFLGVNYYTAMEAAASGGVVLPRVNAVIKADRLQNARPKTDFHWDIHPAGFASVLDEVAQYKLPVYVTENGIADSADVNRSRFLAEHLFELGYSMKRGLEVRGYFHWSLIDNFEWNSGFCPRFGLVAYDTKTKTRTLRKSAQTFARFIQAGRVTQADIDAQPPYAAPSSCE